MNEEPRMGVGHLLLELLWIVVVVLAPALGVWTASSLAAYLNGPVWLTCTLLKKLIGAARSRGASPCFASSMTKLS